MRHNVKKVMPHGFTAEGAPASPMTTEQALRRSVCSCLLGENEFYEDGEEISSRILKLAKQLPPKVIGDLAIEVRSKGNLRHVPLLLLSALAETGKGIPNYVASVVEQTIQRADELAEFLAVHSKVNGVKPDKIKKKISAQMKKGLAKAFGKFSEYSLAKYVQENSASAIKMRDVLFLCHAKPRDEAQDAMWKRLIAGELQTPDTWEVSLSKGADKKETFERLIRENKLGYLALLRNLRNMEQAGCDDKLVKDAIIARKGGAERVLPFRYIAAAKAAPKFEGEIDTALCAALEELPKLDGKTLIVIDVSGSMYGSSMSAKSDMNRALAACAVGAIGRGAFNDVRIYATAGNDGRRIHATREVPPRHGMALVDAVYNLCEPLGGGGIFLKQVMDYLKDREKAAERIIVITDEQDCGINPGDSPLSVVPFGTKNYMINVASHKKGIGYSHNHWVHLDGFSESIFKFIYELETQTQ